MDNEALLKTGIVDVGNIAINVVKSYLEGKRSGGDKVAESIKILSHATKVMHMNQVGRIQERSQALRLLKFLPNDKAREEYIALTNPEAKKLLSEGLKKSQN